METVIALLSELMAEVITILVGTFVLMVLSKVRTYLKRLQAKDELGIIDTVTDAVVMYAEAELKGKKGQEKRDFAVDKAIAILATKGIVVSRDEVIAGIEGGVKKLNHDVPSKIEG